MTNDNRILVVDDEPDIVELYRSYLSDQYDIRTAEGGEDGLDELDETVDVVLLDRRMPGLSGDEVVARIRERRVDTKIIVVTGVEPDMDILGLEFDEYLVKPVTEAELKDAIEDMIARAELEARFREVFRLASKITTLEDKLDIAELEESEQYRQLTEEFRERKEELELPEGDKSYYYEATMSKLRGVFERTGRA